jgi:hypothetical protein
MTMPWGRFAVWACHGLWPSDPDGGASVDLLLDEFVALAELVDAELRCCAVNTPADLDGVLAVPGVRLEVDLSMPVHEKVAAAVVACARQLRRELATVAADAELACMQARVQAARDGLDPYGVQVEIKLDHIAEGYRGSRSRPRVVSAVQVINNVARVVNEQVR